MTRISNYDELVAERRRIEENLARRKSEIAEGIHKLKAKFEPLLYLLPVLGIFKTRTSVLKAGASLALDTIIGKKILAKRTWLTRFVLPVIRKIL
ncbi:MAG TPA: hypothetical protein VIM65_04265 [Cyclobacteriaceae bacterium]